MSRKSSVQARSSALTTRADPRNITDKRFVNNSIRALLDYLTAHNYDNAISPKILTTPSTKDFNNIVQFLFRQIDPNFAYTGKYEDEVIAMFKCLRYPYSISKTALNAVGSPHSWPQLLASVMWIIELLAYDEEATKSRNSEPEIDDPTASEKTFLSYLQNAYVCFLCGNDRAYGDLTEQFIEAFESRNNAAADETKVFDMKNEALNREIEELGERMTYLPELQEKRKLYLKDLGKFQSLIQELQKYKKELDAKTLNRKQELERTTSSLANVEREVEALRHRIANQELSPEDVRRLCEEREHLESALGTAQASKASLESRVQDAEKQLRCKVMDLQDVMKAYSSLGEDLQLLPLTARNAQGRDLALHFDTRAKKRADLVQCDIRGNILPALKELRTDLADATNSIRDKSALLADEIEEVDAQILEQEEQYSGLEAKLQRAEDLYRREREVHEAAAAASTIEIRDLEERLLQVRDTAAEDARVAAASRRVVDARARRQMQREEHQRIRKEIMDSIMDAVTRCADHKEMVERRQGEIRDIYSQRLESLLSQQFQTQQSFAASVSRSASRRAIVPAHTAFSHSGDDEGDHHVSLVGDVNNSSMVSLAGEPHVHQPASSLRRPSTAAARPSLSLFGSVSRTQPLQSADDSLFLQRSSVVANLSSQIEKCATKL
jgi:kinetochore protein NDC80